MKKTIAILSIALTLTSCAPNKLKNTVNDFDTNSESLKEVPVNFTIKKSILSKGYQSTSPNVEVTNSKGKVLSFLVNLGIVECNNVKIDKITRSNNEINIYTSKVTEDKQLDIYVPQFLVQVDNIDNIVLDDLKFNIVNTNYEPLILNYDMKEATNNIKAQFGIVSRYVSDSNLVRENEKLYWHISIFNALKKDDPLSPLINFSGKVDVDSGNIIDPESKALSTVIDKGTILDFKSGSFIVYSQENLVNNISKESIWIYDILNNTKNQLYNTKNSILSAKLSPDSKQIAFIENNKDKSDVFIINLDDSSIKKVSDSNYRHAFNMNWNNKNLYITDSTKADSSSVILYNGDTNESNFLFSVDKTISSIDIYNDNFLLSTFDKDIQDSNLYLTNDGSNLTKIDKGINGVFFKDNIVYKKYEKKKDSNKLWMYNLNTKKTSQLFDGDVFSFFTKDDSIFLKTKLKGDSQYSLMSYNITDNSNNVILKNIDNFFFYDNSNNKVYINIESPINTSKNNIIHLLNNDALQASE